VKMRSKIEKEKIEKLTNNLFVVFRDMFEVSKTIYEIK